MALSSKDFTTLVRNQVTAIQASSAKLLNLNTGSVLRAIVEASAAMLLWLQGLVFQVAALTRAATSNGSDLDSWMADFGLSRLAAVAASGNLTFSRLTTGLAASIPVGTAVQTGDGTQRYAVIADLTNGAYSAGANAYLIASGASSVTVKVQDVVGGAGGNVALGTITVLSTPIVGIDTVTNPAAFTNGVDAESDMAFRLRFVAFLLSLSRATKAAIGYAISNVQQGLTYTITENQNYDGSTNYGFFYVVLDDGTGVPGSTLLGSVTNAIEAYRGFTITFAVFAPIVVTAAVNMTVATATGYDHPTVVGQVGVALAAYINTLPLGTSLPYTKLAAIAYGIAGVTNVSGVTLNGGTTDLTADNKTCIKAGVITVA